MTEIRKAAPEDAEALAAVHATSFADAWDAEVIGAFLRCEDVTGVVAGHPPSGFGLCRRIVDEAEILTLAVAPEYRREGVGVALLGRMMDWARDASARALFLEVAHDNPAGVALYRGAGFREVGRRRGYYSRPGGAMDALVLRLDLNR